MTFIEGPRRMLGTIWRKSYTVWIDETHGTLFLYIVGIDACLARVGVDSAIYLWTFVQPNTSICGNWRELVVALRRQELLYARTGSVERKCAAVRNEVVSRGNTRHNTRDMVFCAILR
jgi:hypothetical protein